LASRPARKRRDWETQRGLPLVAAAMLRMFAQSTAAWWSLTPTRRHPSGGAKIMKRLATPLRPYS